MGKNVYNNINEINIIDNGFQKYNQYLGTHQKNGKLTMVGFHEPLIRKDGVKRMNFLCQCDCGRYVGVRQDNFFREHTQSCGCKASESLSKDADRTIRYDLSGEYGIGYTYDGMTFKFDIDDYELISKYHWSHNNDGYFHNKYGVGLHRFVLGNHEYKKDKLVVDHINHDPNDCRKSNLRYITNGENVKNRKDKNNE